MLFIGAYLPINNMPGMNMNNMGDMDSMMSNMGNMDSMMSNMDEHRVSFLSHRNSMVKTNIRAFNFPHLPLRTTPLIL